jgi:hypothetical protein
VARGIFGNISETRVLLGIFWDRGLILDKNRGLFAKWHGIIGFELFSNGKKAWTRSTVHGPWAALVHGGPRIGPRRWLTGARPNSRSEARWPAGGGTTGRGEHGDPSSGVTEAWATVERRRDGGNKRQRLELGARVKEGARELKREGKRGGEGWGCSLPFYRD